MRFQGTHKLVTYLLVLSAFGALASTESLTLPAAVGFLVAWVLSWPVDPGGRVAAALDKVAVLLRGAVLAMFGAATFFVWRRLPEPDLGPVLNLLLALLAYKLFHRRGNRDYLHVYVLSFLLVLAASALAGTFVFAAAFAVYVVLATWTLILFHLRREMEENYLVKHSAQAPSQKVGVGRILNSRRVVGGSFFAATGAVALGVFAGAVATFAIIPRVGAGFVFGAARATENLVGFSDDVSLGHYGVLSSDNQTVALRAVVPRIAAAVGASRDHEIERLYWRGTVYDRYDGGHWTRSREPALRTVLQAAGPHTFVREPAFEGGDSGERGTVHGLPRGTLARADRQEIDVVGVPLPVVFALDRPVALELAPGGAPGGLRLVPRWSGEVALRAGPFVHQGPRGEAARDLPPGSHGQAGGTATASPPPPGTFGTVGARYVAYSLDGRARAATGGEAGARTVAVADLPPAVRAAYLALPGSLSPRVPELARRLTAGKTAAGERAAALLEWLRSGHTYTVRLPRRPGGVDPVEDFLFDHQEGHCEYFASAMVVLLRAAGIPARYVNGYLGGEWNDIGSYITVRDNRAHSWAEAYVEGAGWLRLDATPSAPGHARAGRLRQLFESADFYWARWVVGYDLDRQVDLARRLGRRLGLGPGDGAASGAGGIAGWMVVLAAVAALAVVASRRWSRGTPKKATARRRAETAATPVHRLYRRALDRLARAGLPRGPAETPHEYAARMSREQVGGGDVLAELTTLYTAARFGGRPVDGGVLGDMARRLPQIGRDP